MTQTISDTFITESGPTAGAIVYGYLASRFTTPPVLNSLPPGGYGADAGPVETGAGFGGPGEFRMVLPTNEPYYLSFDYNGQLSWKYYGNALLTDSGRGTITLAANLAGNSKRATGFADGVGAHDLATVQQVQFAQGTQGPQGEPGAQGPQGDPSTVPGPQGHQGYQGEAGPQGFQGDVGAQGPQGFQGLQGFQGFQGNQGFQGDTGSQGFQGDTGPQGSQGSQGATGAQGATGSQGYQGIAGSGVGSQGDYTNLLPQNYAKSTYVTQAWTTPPETVTSGSATTFGSGALYAYEIVLGTTATITSIQFFLKTGVLSSQISTAYLGVYLFGDTPSSTTPLAQTGNIKTNFQTGTGILQTVDFTSPVTLTAGTKYAIGMLLTGSALAGISLYGITGLSFTGSTSVNLNMAAALNRITLRASTVGSGLSALPDLNFLSSTPTSLASVPFFALGTKIV